jgi:hypothetical protein
MQSVNQPLPSEKPSFMLASVIKFLKEDTKHINHDALAIQLQVPGAWIRAIRDGRSASPNINRIEYIFCKYCNGRVDIAPAV